MKLSPFDAPLPPYQRHSATSKAAARKARAPSTTQRARVSDYLQRCRHNGATDEQMQQALGMNPSTQRPRRIELVQSGDVVDSGVTRFTVNGRRAVVWVATEFHEAVSGLRGLWADDPVDPRYLKREAISKMRDLLDDERTDDEKIADGVAFICDTQVGGS